MKEKKKKSPTQKKHQYKALQYTCFGGEFASVAAPFVAIGAANYNKYFVEYSGTKMSISFIMAFGVMGFAIWGISKKKLNNSFVTMMIIWATMAFIFTMMGSLITDLATIMWFGLIGIGSAYGLDIASKKFEAKAKQIDEGINEAKKEEIKEDFKEEQAEKKETKKKVKW